MDDVRNDPGDYYIEIQDPRRHDRMITKRPNDINLDYYQHPDKRRNPSMRYSRAHDVYSMGCLLLEIGLWKSLDRLVAIEDEDFERTKRSFQALTMELDGFVTAPLLLLSLWASIANVRNRLTGSIYGNIVRSCLAISTSERTESETRQLSKFCAEIAATLDKCNA